MDPNDLGTTLSAALVGYGVATMGGFSDGNKALAAVAAAVYAYRSTHPTIALDNGMRVNQVDTTHPPRVNGMWQERVHSPHAKSAIVDKFTE